MSSETQADPPAGGAEPSNAEDANRKIRKRAKRACFLCHTRKVRCDVVLAGTPCTNCKLDGEECVIRPSTRRWRSSLQWASQQEQREAQQAQQKRSQEQHLNSRASPLPTTQFSNQPNEIGGEVDDSGLSGIDYPFALPDDDIIVPPVEFDHAQLLVPQPTGSHRTSKNSGEDGGTLESVLFPGKSCAKPNAAFVLYTCYPCVEVDDLRRLEPCAIQFLAQCGCFHLPARSILDEFLRQFFLHFYPVLPLFNELEFQKMYFAEPTSQPTQRRISLFLLQAVLFLACPYVSVSKLRKLGFQTVQDARAKFYSRAKLLFDMYPYIDDVARAQGALMLTYHVSSATHGANTFWLSTAIHYAKTAKAHMYTLMHEGSRETNVLKRLWWCCILRDRIMALGLRGQLHIRPADFDFTQPGLVEADFKDEIRGSMVYDSTAKHVLVQLAGMLCELAVALNNILEVLYCETPFRPGGHPPSPEDLKTWSLGLDNWYEKALAKFRLPTPRANKSLILFTNMIYIYYNTAKASLCNHMLLHVFSAVDSKTQDDQMESQLQTQLEMNQALCRITDDLVELEHMGLAKFLPNTFIGFSAFPFIWHLLDAKIRTGPPSHRTERVSKVYADIMKSFRSLYESTDEMLRSAEKIIDYIKEHEQLQVECLDPSILARSAQGEHVATHTLARASYPNNGWVDIFLNRPQTSLRIVMTVDFSLTRGHFPSEADFPKGLRAIQQENHESAIGFSVDADEIAWWTLLQEAMNVGFGG